MNRLPSIVATANGRGGYALLEMIPAVLILALVLTLSATLFKEMLDITETAGRSSQRVAAVDDLIEQLRRDLWQAETVRIGEADGSLRVTLDEGRRVAWDIAAEAEPETGEYGVTRRVVGAEEAIEERRWTLDVRPTFEPMGTSGVVLRLGKAGAGLPIIHAAGHSRAMAGGGP